ncbi:MAG: SpoIIE family protein phosphatase, partial [Candidatus Kapabacteria bacterium]|nr:SpoIIE family protein phosphatase [Candidatus Kapabacteria bacterium]
ELKAKNLQRNFFIAGVIVFIVMFLIAFIRFREKKKLSEELAKQKEEIENQKIIVESQKELVEGQKEVLQEKNEQIYASITYASTIQHAILPWESTLKNAFNDILIFYKPKDIVSGDSYWFQEVEGIKFLAAIDCTGHGTPGAMLTVIASTALDDAVLGKRLSDPAEILTYINEKVTDILNQRLSENQTRDGMEVAMIAIHLDKIQFSGAGRPLYLKNGTLEIIKTDKRGIAGSTKNDEYQFNSIEIKKSENIILYLTTDGFADQMNEDGKKYSTRRFLALLESIADNPLSEQYEILNTELAAHQGNKHQIDDITIIGVRI